MKLFSGTYQGCNGPVQFESGETYETPGWHHDDAGGVAVPAAGCGVVTGEHIAWRPLGTKVPPEPCRTGPHLRHRKWPYQRMTKRGRYLYWPCCGHSEPAVTSRDRGAADGS